MKKLIALCLIVLATACKREEALVAPAAADRVAVAQGAQPAAAPRKIVRTASIRIVVADATKAVEAVTQSVESLGGFVAGSHIWRDGELPRATLTLRVPSATLTTALASIRSLAKRVEDETISSDDVTQEYVDLESRLRNLEATETELRELMTTIRKNTQKASEVLEIHQQVTAIRGEIEQTKGRMRYLDQVAALSQISLEIIPDAIAQPVVQKGWQPLVVARNASRALVAMLQTLADVLIWIVIYVAPIAALFCLAAIAVRKVYRRLRARLA